MDAESLHFLVLYKMFVSVLRAIISFSFTSTAICQSGLDLIAKTDYNNAILKSLPCITEICNVYFNTGQPMGGSIILVSLNARNSILQHKLLKILNRDYEYDWTVMIKDQKEKNDHATIEKAKNYFTIIDKSEDILNIIDQWKSLSTWNPLAQVVIMMGQALDPVELEASRRNLMILLLENRVLNAYIVSIDQNVSRVEVATLFPYDDDNCADRVYNIAILDNCEYDPEVDLNIDSDNIELWEVNNHFENKIPNDLHQCPLLVSARLWEPYALNESDGKFTVGIDVNIVKTLTERMNMELLITPQDTNIYEIYEEIAQGSYDLMIGGVDEDPAMKDYLSSTIPYYQDDLTWCVAKAGPSVTWMKIWGMFDGITWLCVLIFLIASTFFIFGFQLFIDKKKKMVRSILASISIILNQPLMINKYTLPFRFVMLGLIIFGMILNVMYQSMLITTLTKPSSEPQIKAMEELMRLGMRVLGGDEITRHLDKNDSIQSYIRGNLESCKNIDDCLITLGRDKKRAVAASREHVLYNSRIDREDIYCFNVLENIYSYLVAIITIKHFHLLDKFNRIIRLVSEAGLITKWKSELDHAINLRDALTKIKENGPKPITFSELYGIFLMASIMLFISLLVFILEIIVSKNAKKENAHQVWLYIDRKILLNREKIHGGN